MKRTPLPTTTNDGLGRGMEFAVLLLMFLGIGFAMDRWLGTKPLFMLVWTLVAIVGQFVSMWYQYNAQMNMHEQQRRDKLMVSE